MDRKFDGAPNRSWEGMSGSRYSDPMTLMVVRHGGRAGMRSHDPKENGDRAKAAACFVVFSQRQRYSNFTKMIRNDTNEEEFKNAFRGNDRLHLLVATDE